MTSHPVPADQGERRAVDAVLYDFGNVLVGWDPYRAYDGLGRDVVDAFFADVDFRTLNHERDAGATWDDARARVAATHPQHVPLLDRYLDRFPATLTGPVDGSEELVRELDGLGVRLYGLTNWSAELYPHAAPAAPATTLMRDVLVSGREGLAKPDPAIFSLAIARFGLDPARTLFTDDSPANVDAAARLGLRTHLFEHTPGLRAALRDLGVPVSPASA
ncbi:HAD family hydrolase [Cellulosimicrobium marinum]|uniref:HAD family hydrolase n=1 Tax=Cellulosimicrobium marinum TaxID=1638992 RepID=UPI001E37058B|nr:HAD family phosphatase [Cellulosimicrobium marinum]MCB7137558.1 HAD family phosphatase [Cellulosimicrobium marinum]